jgi:ubiquinone/menaquinone biosynthesis C-methylase UbiE
MVAVARRQHPELRFAVGQLAALELPDGQLAGALAWYSIIHTPPPELPGVCAEFFRVLAPGGYLLLAFQVGDEAVQLRQGYGHDLSLTAYRLPVQGVERMLAAAGFQAVSCLVREPQLPEKTLQAYILVRKSADATR